MEALGLNLGYILVQFFSFLIVFVLLKSLVYQPILDMLEQRRKTIAKGIEAANAADEVRAKAANEAQAIIEKGQQEAAELIQDAARQAEIDGREMKVQAENEADEIHAAAIREAAQLKEEALDDLRGQVVMLTIAAANNLIGRIISKQRQTALIEEFFSGVKSGKVVMLEGEYLTGRNADVTSALPLNPAEQKSVRNEINAQIGPSAEITFNVDTSILGGLVIRVGDRVIDASVSRKLQSLQQSLQ